MSKQPQDEYKIVTELFEQAEELGLTKTVKQIANMNVEEIVVPDVLIKLILKTINLTIETQEEVMDKLVERTPGYYQLPAEDAVAKITTALTLETVIESLRLVGVVRTNVDMIETGINDNGSIIVTAFYMKKSKLEDNVFKKKMTERELNLMEKEINLFHTNVDILEEAKKRINNKDNVIPFQSREQRRLEKARRGKKK